MNDHENTPPLATLTFGKVAFNLRLDDLKAQRAALDAKIEEMQQWIALCDSATEAES